MAAGCGCQPEGTHHKLSRSSTLSGASHIRSASATSASCTHGRAPIARRRQRNVTQMPHACVGVFAACAHVCMSACARAHAAALHVPAAACRHSRKTRAVLLNADCWVRVGTRGTRVQRQSLWKRHAERGGGGGTQAWGCGTKGGVGRGERGPAGGNSDWLSCAGRLVLRRRTHQLILKLCIWHQRDGGAWAEGCSGLLSWLVLAVVAAVGLAACCAR